MTWLVLVGLTACGDAGGGGELRHEKPGFRAKVPGDLKVGADKPDAEGGASLSVALNCASATTHSHCGSQHIRTTHS